MIKVNLLEERRRGQIPQIMGVDISTINFRFVAFAILISILPKYLVINGWKEDISIKQNEINELNQTLKSLQAKNKGDRDIQSRIEAFVKQESVLQDRLLSVKEVIKLKKNPREILFYISKNIPENVWMNNLKIDGDTLTITGEATDYKGIGSFLERLTSSVFFVEGQPTLVDTESNTETKTEKYVLSGKIKRYD